MKPVLPILLTACLCAGFAAAAQPLDTASANKWSAPGGQNPALEFYEAKMGKPFTLTGIQTASDGKTIDFSRLERPAFVYFGFYGCHPCMHELPVVIETSADHPDVDFVYITYDKKPVRDKEFAELGKRNFKPGSNFYIIELHDEEIYRKRLTWGYPTKYFLDKNGIVQFVQSGGNPSEPTKAIKARFKQVVNGG